MNTETATNEELLSELKRHKQARINGSYSVKVSSPNFSKFEASRSRNGTQIHAQWITVIEREISDRLEVFCADEKRKKNKQRGMEAQQEQMKSLDESITEETTTLTRAEWIEHVEEFRYDEGLITFNEAETLMSELIENGKLERPER